MGVFDISNHEACWGSIYMRIHALTGEMMQMISILAMPTIKSWEYNISQPFFAQTQALH